jgi:hypothetical protein
MDWAAGEAAFAARGATDPATVERVPKALLDQLGGGLLAAPALLLGPSGYMDQRTATPLSHVRRDAR